MAHEHKIHDSDVHFIIDPITRQLTTESKKVNLIQFDHNSERFTFQLPRYIEDHDMSLSDIAEIHYINGNPNGPGEGKNVDIYMVDDLQVSPDSDNVVIGSWLISANATQFVGNLNFAIRFACIDDDNKITYQWATNVYSNITIVQGINNAGAISVDVEENDLINAWKKEILRSIQPSIDHINNQVAEAESLANDSEASAYDSAQSAIAAKKSEDAAAASAQAAADSVSEIENSLATAVKETIEEVKNIEANASYSATTAASNAQASAISAQASAISAQAAATSADNAQNAEYRADALNKATYDQLKETEDLLTTVEQKIADSVFTMNFATGNLELTSASYKFRINNTTGNLEWEVA